jgi:predicted GNAT family acetyltransferase
MTETDQPVRVTDNAAAHRFEAHLGDDLVGFAEYTLAPGRVIFTHTETLPAFEGKGVGSRLAAGALDEVRSRGLVVTRSARSSPRTFSGTPSTPTSSTGATIPRSRDRGKAVIRITVKSADMACRGKAVIAPAMSGLGESPTPKESPHRARQRPDKPQRYSDSISSAKLRSTCDLSRDRQ